LCLMLAHLLCPDIVPPPRLGESYHRAAKLAKRKSPQDGASGGNRLDTFLPLG
jgi:hypothetical protein